jgi:hypothetical protein
MTYSDIIGIPDESFRKRWERENSNIRAPKTQWVSTTHARNSGLKGLPIHGNHPKMTH